MKDLSSKTYLFITAIDSELVIIKVEIECGIGGYQKSVQDEWTAKNHELLALAWAESSYLEN